MTEENPYQKQTDANTGTGWLGDQKPVDVDLDGMVEFATNMVTIKENLASHTGRLELLSTVPGNAWENGALPEGVYAMKKMLHNYAELQQYTMHLKTALDNIGMAAQTIADIYRDTDGWSSADLNAVRFVFGDSGAPRPAGLPAWFPVTTYWDEYFKQTQQAQNSPNTAGVKWADRGEVRNADGSVTQRSVAPDGRVMEIRTFTVPGGGPTIVTTTLLSPQGTVLSSTRQHTSTHLTGANTVVSTSTNYDQHGTATGGKTKSVTYGDSGQVTGESVVSTDKDGNQTAKTETRTNADGSQTITTYQDEKVVRVVQVGGQTAGSVGAVDSPTKDAMDRVEGKYKAAGG